MAIKKTPIKKDPPKKEKILPAEVTQDEIEKVVESLNAEPEEVIIDLTDADLVQDEPPPPPTLTRDELMRLQLSQFQMRAFDAEMRLEALAKDLYLQQIDPKGKLNEMINTIRQRNAELVRAKADYEAVTKEIESRLKLNLKEYAYDDLTGALNKLPE